MKVSSSYWFSARILRARRQTGGSDRKTGEITKPSGTDAVTRGAGERFARRLYSESAFRSPCTSSFVRPSPTPSGGPVCTVGEHRTDMCTSFGTWEHRKRRTETLSRRKQPDRARCDRAASQSVAGPARSRVQVRLRNDGTGFDLKPWTRPRRTTRRAMDSKRPGVRVDEQPDEEGRVTTTRTDDADSELGLRARLSALARRLRDTLVRR